jgi:hypothetical protein
MLNSIACFGAATSAAATVTMEGEWTIANLLSHLSEARRAHQVRLCHSTDRCAVIGDGLRRGHKGVQQHIALDVNLQT